MEIEPKKERPLIVIGTDALFLLKRMLWEMTDSPDSNGQPTDQTWDRACALVKEAHL